MSHRFSEFLLTRYFKAESLLLTGPHTLHMTRYLKRFCDVLVNMLSARNVALPCSASLQIIGLLSDWMDSSDVGLEVSIAQCATLPATPFLYSVRNLPHHPLGSDYMTWKDKICPLALLLLRRAWLASL